MYPNWKNSIKLKKENESLVIKRMLPRCQPKTTTEVVRVSVAREQGQGQAQGLVNDCIEKQVLRMAMVIIRVVVVCMMIIATEVRNHPTKVNADAFLSFQPVTHSLTHPLLTHCPATVFITSFLTPRSFCDCAQAVDEATNDQRVQPGLVLSQHHTTTPYITPYNLPACLVTHLVYSVCTTTLVSIHIMIPFLLHLYFSHTH